MPKLKLRKEFKETMIAVGCYDEWKSELVRQWDYKTNRSANNRTAAELESIQYQKENTSSCLNIAEFISRSFIYATVATASSGSSNGHVEHQRWQDIIDKCCEYYNAHYLKTE